MGPKSRPPAAAFPTLKPLLDSPVHFQPARSPQDGHCAGALFAMKVILPLVIGTSTSFLTSSISFQDVCESNAIGVNRPPISQLGVNGRGPRFIHRDNGIVAQQIELF